MDFLQLLDYLGITPKQIVPSLVVGGFFLLVVNKFFISGIKTDIGMIKDEVRDLHNAAKEIQIHLASDGGFSAQHSLDQKPLFEQYGQHASPMQPSEKGMELLKAAKFYEMYDLLKDRIFEQMDKMNLRTLYDYESGASRALFLLSNDPAMDQVKEHVVNNPDKQLELIFGIASWIIRDDYAKHKQ
jgi:hypothetical protein